MGQCYCQPGEVEWHIYWHDGVPPKFEHDPDTQRKDVYKVHVRKQDRIDKVARAFEQWREADMGPSRLCACFYRQGVELAFGHDRDLRMTYTLDARLKTHQMGDIVTSRNPKRRIVTYVLQDRVCSGLCCFCCNMLIFPCQMMCNKEEEFDPNREFLPAEGSNGGRVSNRALANAEAEKENKRVFRAHGNKLGSPNQRPIIQPQRSVADDIGQLKTLRDDGALSDDQYKKAVDRVIAGNAYHHL